MLLLLQVALFRVDNPPDCHVITQLTSKTGTSPPWLVPMGDMARAGHWGLLNPAEQSLEASNESDEECTSEKRGAELRALLRFLGGTEVEVCVEAVQCALHDVASIRAPLIVCLLMQGVAHSCGHVRGDGIGEGSISVEA